MPWYSLTSGDGNVCLEKASVFLPAAINMILHSISWGNNTSAHAAWAIFKCFSLEEKSESLQILDSSKVSLPTYYNPTPHYLQSHRYNMWMFSPLLFSDIFSSLSKINKYINKVSRLPLLQRLLTAQILLPVYFLWPQSMPQINQPPTTTEKALKILLFLLLFISAWCSSQKFPPLTDFFFFFPSFHPVFSFSRSPLLQTEENSGCSHLSYFPDTRILSHQTIS